MQNGACALCDQHCMIWDCVSVHISMVCCRACSCKHSDGQLRVFCLKTPRAPGSQAPLEISCTSHWSAIAGDMGYSRTSVLHVKKTLSSLLTSLLECGYRQVTQRHV